MTYIHFPTLLLHSGLVIFGAITINDYPGTFLPIAVVVLIAHALWAARSRHSLWPAHLFGSLGQLALYHLDVIDVYSGAFGLGGGEYAWFFYEIALVISCIAEVLIGLVKYAK